MSILLLIGFAAFTLLAVQSQRAAFFLFLGLLPTYLVRFSLFGMPTTALEVLFLILFVVWLLKREKRFVDISGWKLLILFWVVAATISVFVSPDIRSAMGIWKAYFIEPVIFFIMANDFLRSGKDRRLAVKVLAGTAMVIGVSAIVQKFTLWGVPPPWNALGEFRATSFYGFPNAVGLFLAPLVPLFAVMSIRSWRQHARESYYWLAAIALSLAGIGLARSEGAMVGIIAGLVLIGVMFRRTRLATIGLAAAAAVILIALPMTRPMIVEKLSLEDWSGRVRKEMWVEASNMLKDRPILGAGLSGYPIVFEPYHKAGHIEIFQYPHNLILNFWSELGLAGVLVFILIIIQFFRKAHHEGCNFRQQNPWFIGLSATMLVILIHGLVDVPYFKNDLSFQFWLIAALLSASTVHGKRKIKKTSK